MFLFERSEEITYNFGEGITTTSTTTTTTPSITTTTSSQAAFTALSSFDSLSTATSSSSESSSTATCSSSIQSSSSDETESSHASTINSISSRGETESSHASTILEFDDDSSDQSKNTDISDEISDIYHFGNDTFHHDSHVQPPPYQNTKFFAPKWRTPARFPPHKKLPKCRKIYKRNRPSKRDLYRIVLKLHTYNQRVQAKAIIADNWNKKSGPLRYIKRSPADTIRFWRRKYAFGSQHWNQLCKYIEKVSTKKAHQQFSFKIQPFSRREYGFLPVVEDYLLQLRLLKMSTSELRSMRWLTRTAKELFDNDFILDLLKLRMDERELNAIVEFKRDGFSRGWLRNILVLFLHERCVDTNPNPNPNFLFVD